MKFDLAARTIRRACIVTFDPITLIERMNRTIARNQFAAYVPSCTEDTGPFRAQPTVVIRIYSDRQKQELRPHRKLRLAGARHTRLLSLNNLQLLE